MEPLIVHRAFLQQLGNNRAAYSKPNKVEPRS